MPSVRPPEAESGRQSGRFVKSWKRSFFALWEGRPVEWTCFSASKTRSSFFELWTWKYLADTDKNKAPDKGSDSTPSQKKSTNKALQKKPAKR